MIETGRHKYRFVPTPHLPHGWDAGVLFEERSGVLLCSDLFHQLGDVEPVTSADVLGRWDAAIAAYQAHPVLMDYVPLTPATRRRLNELADLQPRVLAAMHGSWGTEGPRCVPPLTCCTAGSVPRQLTHSTSREYRPADAGPASTGTPYRRSSWRHARGRQRRSARAPHRRRPVGVHRCRGGRVVSPLRPAGAAVRPPALPEAESAAVEEHLFSCAAFGAQAAELDALVHAIRPAVRSAEVGGFVTDAVLNRLAREGVRVRTFALSPGAIVPCAVWDDDELVVLRMRGDIGGASGFTLSHSVAGTELSRVTGQAAPSPHGEIIYVVPAARIRQLPIVQVDIVLTAHEGGEERAVGNYTLVHGGLLHR